LVDQVQAARDWLNKVVDKARKDPSWRSQLKQDSANLLRPLGLQSGSDADGVAAVIEHRATMTDDLLVVRHKLDEVSDRARRDPKWQAELLNDPEKALLSYGFTQSDAASVASEMQHDVGHGHLRCSFTCCRHPPTDSCDPSVLVSYVPGQAVKM
jgi:hypothetical protein